MLIIEKTACARAGLVGNPSDGYNGKTLAFSMKNFQAKVVLYEWEDVEMVQTSLDQSRFSSVQDLVRDVKLHGYYGGMRLLKATVKKFVEYCENTRRTLHDRNFSVRYESNIPRQVGLAGSSAIIVATLRCLMEFYEIDIPLEVQPSLVLAVENEELGISAGLQDRVIQVYDGLVFMDFSKEKMRKIDGFDCGVYERLDPALLPSLYVAYNPDVSEPGEIFHNDLRGRFLRNESDVVQAMQTFARLAEEARQALLTNDPQRLRDCINENFNTRLAICRLPEKQKRMVDVSQETGASAKFAGSGGAIVGTYQGEAMYAELERILDDIDCAIIKPEIRQPQNEES